MVDSWKSQIKPPLTGGGPNQQAPCGLGPLPPPPAGPAVAGRTVSPGGAVRNPGCHPQPYRGRLLAAELRVPSQLPRLGLGSRLAVCPSLT